jgi:hypothetical protein
MKKVCSWCGKELKHSKVDQSDHNLLSHGICDDCKFHILAQGGVKLREYLNHVGVPVFIVDKDNRILASNKQAVETFKKKLPKVDDVLCGVVFECDHARLPEGCGKTVHCSGCTVRICIAKTIETGEVFTRVPAYLDCTQECTNKVHFLISTEKFGDAVIMRVEDVSSLDLYMDHVK